MSKHDKPEFWWQDEAIHAWFKEEKKKLSKEAKRQFEKKHHIKKDKKDKSD